MKPSVRWMTASDKAAITQILKQIPEFETDEVPVAEELIDSYLQDSTLSGYYIMVADSDSKAVGYICYGNTPLTKGTWDIYWMAVSPAEQAKGIGKALMAAAEKEIEAREGRLILIETSSKPVYERTRRFHQAQGYELICCIPDFYSPGDDKLIYRKRILRTGAKSS
jgi:ribosomal protein S18 acetylase RimI-like enzyme